MMKYIKANSSINGTTYYKCSIDDIAEAIHDEYSDVYMDYVLAVYGLDGLDMKHSLLGSDIIDDTLYLCVTDSEPITINGKSYDPEFALFEAPIEELSEYIKDSTPEIITRYISSYEIKQYPLNDIIPDMLDDGYKFTEIVQSDILSDMITDYINESI